MAVQLDFDRRGRMFVLEHSSGPGGPFQGAPGRLLRVRPDCVIVPVETGLPAPMSFAVGPGEDAYVSLNGTGPGTGSVARFEM